MDLEDNYEDIIRKAERGLNKKIDSSDIDEVARELNLNVRALKKIKDGKYKPKAFDYGKNYDGLKVVNIRNEFYGRHVNAYVVFDEDKNCAIVDTAQSPERIIKEIKERKLNPRFILLTHGDGDHVYGKEKIVKEFGIGIYSGDDLKNNQELKLDDRKIKAVKTPGHSKDSVTYSIGMFLFVGDLIFAGSLEVVIILIVNYWNQLIKS
ncbi:MBL fold metallo-hydrolase [Candidatus Woesearchaeota archaeon]|nr:MBL fold metallo-hydrolase [Candidatus Woesearchaeota archaeon]